MPVLTDLGRVDVGVNHLGLRRKRVQLPGNPVIESGTQGDQQIAALQCGHRTDRAVHPGHTHVQLVAVGECTARHKGGDDGDAGQFGQFLEFRGGVRTDDTATDVQHRALGGGDEPDRLTNLLAVRLGDRLVAGQVDLRRPAERGLCLQDVLGDVHEHRTGTAALRDVEGLGDHLRDVLGVAHQEVVLGDGHRDAGDVGFLESIRTDEAATHLAGDRHNRDRVHLRVGQRGDQVGGTGAGGGHHDADLAGGMRVTAGGMPGTLLMTHQHVAHLGGVVERVIDGQDRTTGNAEDHFDAELLKRPHYRLRAGDALGCDGVGFRGCSWGPPRSRSRLGLCGSAHWWSVLLLWPY
ncbi:Uncharacterised protein [Mycobacteroides abscessus subsp. abscessus]|nr:Uncharacterised protein [Mycobacteroides abscessus subsp. abscessus]